MNTHSIAVVGGGVAGLVTALGLAQAGLSVQLLDARNQAPEWQRERPDLRVVALTRASQQVLERLGVWEGVHLRRASAYTGMQVWDGQGSGRIRFDARELGEPDLGHIVETSVLETALTAAVERHPQIRITRGAVLSALKTAGDAALLTLADGRQLQAALVVGADGAQSTVRALADLPLSESPYEHVALVATVASAQPHQATAWQRFTATGPLALLPLCDPHQLSIVWSQPPAEAERLKNLDDAAFSAALTAASEAVLGTLTVQSPRVATPLIARHAERYSGERVVLVADAAHTIHPLAGQGLNLGLADVEALVKLLAEASPRGIDLGDARLLAQYDRARRPANTLMLAGMRAFKEGFTRDELPLVLARNFGLSLVDRHPLLKALFAKLAMRGAA